MEPSLEALKKLGETDAGTEVTESEKRALMRHRPSHEGAS